MNLKTINVRSTTGDISKLNSEEIDNSISKIYNIINNSSDLYFLKQQLTASKNRLTDCYGDVYHKNTETLNEEKAKVNKNISYINEKIIGLEEFARKSATVRAVFKDYLINKGFDLEMFKKPAYEKGKYEIDPSYKEMVDGMINQKEANISKLYYDQFTKLNNHNADKIFSKINFFNNTGVSVPRFDSIFTNYLSTLKNISKDYQDYQDNMDKMYNDSKYQIITKRNMLNHYTTSWKKMSIFEKLKRSLKKQSLSSLIKRERMHNLSLDELKQVVQIDGKQEKEGSMGL